MPPKCQDDCCGDVAPVAAIQAAPDDDSEDEGPAFHTKPVTPEAAEEYRAWGPTLCYWKTWWPA